MGFIMHFYIIFGTNLLTQGPVQIVVFCLFQCFAEKEYQTESKRNKTSGRVILDQTWSRGLQVAAKQPTRRPWARGRPSPPHPHHRLFCSLEQGPSLMDHVRWENHVPEDFILFGLRLIFYFFETLKYAKKQQFWAGPPVNRLVPKVI